LGEMLESYPKLQTPKPKTVREFKDTLYLIWSAVPEKAINEKKITASDCGHGCRPALDMLNIRLLRLTNTDR